MYMYAAVEDEPLDRSLIVGMYMHYTFLMLLTDVSLDETQRAVILGTIECFMLE